MVQGINGVRPVQQAYGNGQAAGVPGLVPINFGASRDSFHGGAQQPQRELGFFEAAGSVLKGATVNTVKSLLSPTGLLTAAAGVALCVATGGAAVPFLLAGSMALGGVQVVTNGISAYSLAQAGDIEGAKAALENVGSGITSIGLGAFGARVYANSGASAGVSTSRSVGQVFSESYHGVRNGLSNVGNLVTQARTTGVNPTVTQVRADAASAMQTGKSRLDTAWAFRDQQFQGVNASGRQTFTPIRRPANPTTRQRIEHPIQIAGNLGRNIHTFRPGALESAAAFNNAT